MPQQQEGAEACRYRHPRLALGILSVPSWSTCGRPLAKKDLVLRERDGRAWRYRPADTREALTAATMRRTLDDMDVADRRTALLHFLDGATNEEIEDLKSALAQLEARAASTGEGGAGSPSAPGPEQRRSVKFPRLRR